MRNMDQFLLEQAYENTNSSNTINADKYWLVTLTRDLEGDHYPEGANKKGQTVRHNYHGEQFDKNYPDRPYYWDPRVRRGGHDNTENFPLDAITWEEKYDKAGAVPGIMSKVKSAKLGLERLLKARQTFYSDGWNDEHFVTTINELRGLIDQIENTSPPTRD